jgi:hypothetical protein
MRGKDLNYRVVNKEIFLKFLGLFHHINMGEQKLED